MKSVYSIIVFLLLLSSVVCAEVPDKNLMPLTVKVEVNKNPVSIGDRIKYIIEVKSPREIEVKFPSFAENLADFTIRDFGSSEGGFWGSRTLTQWYILDTFETGTFTIPGITIQFRDKKINKWKETVSEEITIEVKSLLSETAENAEIRDIEPPLNLSNPAYLYILAALIAVIIIAIIIIMVLKKKKAPKNTVIPLPPAHETAFEALSDLMNKDYLKTGKIREYYFELSDIVRHYLENRFQLKAPEMTTDEFLSNLKSTKVMRSEHKSLLRDFLSHCDMVKFARYKPEEDEIESSYESAQNLVEQTKQTDEGVTKT